MRSQQPGSSQAQRSGEPGEGAAAEAGFLLVFGGRAECLGDFGGPGGVGGVHVERLRGGDKGDVGAWDLVFAMFTCVDYLDSDRMESLPSLRCHSWCARNVPPLALGFENMEALVVGERQFEDIARCVWVRCDGWQSTW